MEPRPPRVRGDGRSESEVLDRAREGIAFHLACLRVPVPHVRSRAVELGEGRAWRAGVALERARPSDEGLSARPPGPCAGQLGGSRFVSPAAQALEAGA